MDAQQRRAKWGEGPWIDEPDEGMWEAHGFRCMFVRNSELGTLCGYVAVPNGHPWFGLGYDEVTLKWEVDVHGGLTFADDGIRPSPDGLWYLGFDTAHMNDLVPQVAKLCPDHFKGNTYKDLAYVRAETEQLAEQAREASKP